MGRVIALDSTIFIYFLQEHKEFGPAAKRLFKLIEVGQLGCVFSRVGLIEILTGPKKTGRLELLLLYREFMTTMPNLQLIGLDDAIVEVASDLRAKYGLRTPDAIHLASAIAHRATAFVTNDARLKQVKEIKIKMLKDVGK